MEKEITHPHLCIRYSVLLKKFTSIAIATDSHNVQLLLSPFIQIARSVVLKIRFMLMYSLHIQYKPNHSGIIPDESDVYTKSSMYSTAV